jgi:hypothetical protein
VPVDHPIRRRPLPPGRLTRGFSRLRLRSRRVRCGACTRRRSGRRPWPVGRRACRWARAAEVGGRARSCRRPRPRSRSTSGRGRRRQPGAGVHDAGDLTFALGHQYRKSGVADGEEVPAEDRGRRRGRRRSPGCGARTDGVPGISKAPKPLLAGLPEADCRAAGVGDHRHRAHRPDDHGRPHHVAAVGRRRVTMAWTSATHR